MSGRVSAPCWHATTVANALWKPFIIGEGQARYKGHEIGGKCDGFGSHCSSRIRMSFNIHEKYNTDPRSLYYISSNKYP